MISQHITRIVQLLIIITVPGALMGSLTKQRGLRGREEFFPKMRQSHEVAKLRAENLKMAAFFDILEALPEDVIKRMIRKNTIPQLSNPQDMVNILEAIPYQPKVIKADYEDQETPEELKKLYRQQAMRAAIYDERTRMYIQEVAKALNIPTEPAVSFDKVKDAIHQACGGKIVDGILYDPEDHETKEYFGVPRGRLGTLEALEQWLWLAQAFELDIPLGQIWQRQARNYRWSRDNEKPDGSWACDKNTDIIKSAQLAFQTFADAAISREELQAIGCSRESTLKLNNIRYIPRIFPQVAKNMSDVRLTNIQPSALQIILPALHQVKNLSIQISQQIQDFWPLITKLQNLQRLQIWNTDITEVPASIDQLKKLKELDLQENAIARLDPSIGSLSHLETLNLRKNALTSLPRQIGQLKNLQTLNLRDNQLTDLPKTILDLISLTTLDLYNNKFTRIPAVFDQEATQLIPVIDLSVNPIPLEYDYPGPYALQRNARTQLILLVKENS